MKRFFCNQLLVIFVLVAGLATAGCIGQKTLGVPLLEPDPVFVECDQALAMDLQGVSDDNLYALLDHSWDQGGMDGCWEELMEAA